jgi:uncharacterized protein
MKATLLASKRVRCTFTGKVPYIVSDDKTRRGDWIQTFTGRKFWPLDPRVGDWHLADIAHSLSMHPRFGGHTTRFYPVSQHSIFVSDRLPERLKLEGLLHDAHESIYLDFPRPLKNCFPEYSKAEEMGAISLRKQFKIPTWFEKGLSMAPRVKVMDNLALVTERRDLMRDAGHYWAAELESIIPDPEHIEPMSPAVAEIHFISRFVLLTA